jgi:hypothetical protein
MLRFRYNIILVLLMLGLQACSFRSVFYVRNKTNEPVSVVITGIENNDYRQLVDERGGLPYGINVKRCNLDSFYKFENILQIQFNNDTLHFDIPQNATAFINARTNRIALGKDIRINNRDFENISTSPNLIKKRISQLFIYDIK